MEILRRWRETMAITLLVATAVRLLAGIVAVALLSSDEGYGSFATAALFEGSQAADTLLLLATAGAAVCCLLSPPTPSARTLGALALVEIVAAVLVALVFGLMGLASEAVGRGIQFVQLLATLALPALAASLLLALLRSATNTSVVLAQHDQALAVAPGDAPQPTSATLPALPPALPPGWQPEQATGMVWQTAGEAAAGAPPTGWPPAGEAPGGAAGWQPIPGSGEQPGANRSS